MLGVIDQDFAGNADGNGNYTLAPTASSPTQWAALKVTASTTGNALWQILVNGVSKVNPRGAQIDVPILIQPAQKVSVVVTAAVPGAAVIGKIHGISGDSLEEVAPFVSLAPSLIAVETISTRQAVTGSTPTLVTPTDASTVSVSFPIQKGTQAISLLINNPTLMTLLSLTGNVTNIQYVVGLTLGPPFPNTSPYRFVVESAYDTVLTLSCAATAGSVVRIWATAIMDPEVVFVANQESVGVDVVDRAARLLGHVTVDGTPTVDVTDRLARQEGRVVLVSTGNFPFITDDQGGGVLSLGVSELNARPASWQVPSKCAAVASSIAAGATLVVVAGVANQVVRVFPTSLSIDTAVATGALSFQDTGGNEFHQFNMGQIVMNPFLGSGHPRGVGLGLQLFNATGGAVSIRGSVPFSQP